MAITDPNNINPYADQYAPKKPVTNEWDDDTKRAVFIIVVLALLAAVGYGVYKYNQMHYQNGYDYGTVETIVPNAGGSTGGTYGTSGKTNQVNPSTPTPNNTDNSNSNYTGTSTQ